MFKQCHQNAGQNHNSMTASRGKGILHAFLTSALHGDEWSASRPGRFTRTEKSPWYPSDRRMGGPQRRSGRHSEEKHS